MDKDLEMTIRAAYPSQRLDDLDEAKLGLRNQDARLIGCIERLREKFPVGVDSVHSQPQRHEIAFTHIYGPQLKAWLYGMQSEEKLSLIECRGFPFVILWLHVSRVSDYYRIVINHWTVGKEQRNLDVDFSQEPDDEWHSILAGIERELRDCGFNLLPPEMTREKVEFLLRDGYDDIPYDDPRWDEEGFEPPDVLASVYEAVFGEH